MLFLHSEFQRDLKWNGEPLFEATKAIISENLNGSCQLKLTYPITDSMVYALLKADKLISSPSPTVGRQFFRIKTVSEKDDHVEVMAFHISDDIMKRRIAPFVVNGTDCQTALNRLVASARSNLSEFSFESDIPHPHVFTIEKETTFYSALMDGAHSILGTWEGELVRDNRLLFIKMSRGQDKGEILSTHNNIKSYDRTIDSAGVYTRVIARSKFKPESEKEERSIEVVVDSPLIGHYPYVNEVTYENNNLKTREELTQWARRKFSHESLDKPKDKLVIKAYQVDGTVLHLADTVHIKSRKHRADFKKKVIAYSWDALAKEYLDFTFDDRVTVGGSTSSPIGQLAGQILDIKDVGLENIQAEIDASNKRFDLKEEKLREEILQGISKAESKAEEAVAAVQQKVGEVERTAQKLNESVQEHNLMLVNHLQKLGEATSLAQSAKSQSSEAIRQLESVKDRLDSTNQRLATTHTELEQVQSKATELLAKTNGITSQLSGFQTKVDNLTQTISSKAEKTVVDSINQQVSNQAVAIQKALDGLSSKVSSTDYDGLKATVSSHTSQLTQTSSMIRDLVSKSSQVNNKLSTIETEVTKQAGQISQRLTASQVDTILGGKGYQTKAQVDANISSRHFVATSTLDNRLTETVQGYTREISRVEGKIPQQVGGRNYIRDFGDTLAKSHNNNVSEWSIVAIDDGTSTSGKTMVATCTKAGYGGFHRPIVDLRDSRFDGKAMTFSFEIKASRTVVMGLGAEIFDNNSQNVTVGTNWQRFVQSSVVKLKQFWSFVWYIRSGQWAVGDKVYVRDLQLEDGLIASTPKPAIEDLAQKSQLQRVESTVDQHSRTFSQLGTVPENLKWSTIKQTVDKVTTTIGDSTVISKTVQTALVNLQAFKDLQSGLSSQQSLTASHYALKFFRSNSDVLSQLNLNSGGVKIQGKLIHLNGQTLIDNGVIQSAMISSLDAGKITTGYLSAYRIASQAITGDKIKFDQAFFNQMTANEALFKQIFAKSAFITAVQAVSLSASRIVGGTLQATNRAMSINLNQANISFNSTATIDFNSSNNALKRKVGDVTGFLHFNNATAGGTYVGLGVTSHNEGVKSQDTGRFAGIRIFRSNDQVDQTELYGDTIFLGHAFNGHAIKVNATRLDRTYEMIDVLNSIKSLWRCWLHFNNVAWNSGDNNFGRAVINEYNSHHI